MKAGDRVKTSQPDQERKEKKKKFSQILEIKLFIIYTINYSVWVSMKTQPSISSKLKIWSTKYRWGMLFGRLRKHHVSRLLYLPAWIELHQCFLWNAVDSHVLRGNLQCPCSVGEVCIGFLQGFEKMIFLRYLWLNLSSALMWSL